MKNGIVIGLLAIAGIAYYQGYTLDDAKQFIDKNSPESLSDVKGSFSELLDKQASQFKGFETQLADAFKNKQSNIQVRGHGLVERILADDLTGSRHQRIIIKLATGQTLLIAHNIDLARRVKPLSVGDTLEFYGEYEWNDKGGVIHWTHHDPDGFHPAGYLKHNGKTYQ